MPDDALMELELPTDDAVDELALGPTEEGEETAKPVEGQEDQPADPTPITSLLSEDGKKLHPQVKEQLEKLKAENPSVAKLVRESVFRSAQLLREFPGGLTEARELREGVEKFGGLAGIEEKLAGAAELDTLAQQFMGADPAFVEDMVASSPEAFNALAPVVFGKYAETNPEGFAAYIGRIVMADMTKADVPLIMMRLGDVVADNPKAAELVQQLSSYLVQFKTLAGKPINTPAPRPAPKTAPTANKEEELRAREWKADRQDIERSIVDSAFQSALAGRKPTTEERAQIKELFASRSLAKANELFPGWQEKSQRFIRSNDKAGYLRYVKSIYTRVVPDVMASAVRSTLRGAARPTPINQPKPAAAGTGKPADGFKFTAEPDTWQIDYGRTDPSMLRQNRAILKKGERVQWK